jgi:hypothetical protein
MEHHCFFFTSTRCAPCEEIKPFYAEHIRPIYTMNGITCSEHSFQDLDTKKLMDLLEITKVPSLCIVKIPQLGHALTESWSSYMERTMDSDDAEVILRAVNKNIEKEAMDIVWKICNNEAEGDADGEDF